jgi:hypothetical protein
MDLPPPMDISRQVGVAETGSPIELSRGSSGSSSPVNPEIAMRLRLVSYKVYLEHEIDFVRNEIQALGERDLSADPFEDQILRELQDGLKVRYNALQIRLTRALALLEVM